MAKEDLGIKVGTDEEIYWTDVKRKCEESIQLMEHDIIIFKNTLILAELKIKEEKEKI